MMRIVSHLAFVSATAACLLVACTTQVHGGPRGRGGVGPRGRGAIGSLANNERGWYGEFESDRSTPPKLREYSEKDVMNVLAFMRAEFDIDDNRIYIMGSSMGGAGALHL